MDTSKILMVSGQGFYSSVNYVITTQELEPDSEKKIHTRNLSPYGFQFDFEYFEERDSSKLPSKQKKSLLEKAVKDLNKQVSNAGADYVLVSKMNPQFADSHYYEIKGKAQLLCKKNF